MDIKLLKAGESGFGYLIEQDAGVISPNEPRNQSLIREFSSLESGKRDTETLIVYVILQKYGVKNRNGRIYPQHLLKTQNEIYQEAIRQRRAVGELDHPESSIISGDRISHNIIETWWEGHTLMGKMEILMTDGYIKFGIVSTKGDLVAHYLQRNIMIGVSSRGVGSLKEVKGDFIVQDDFELICWDVVTAPSTLGSWIFKDRGESRPYVENVTTNKSTLTESLDNFLLDIL